MDPTDREMIQQAMEQEKLLRVLEKELLVKCKEG